MSGLAARREARGTHGRDPRSVLPSGLNPVDPFRSAWRFRDLIVRLARRDVAARYRGSLLGGLWSLLTPLLLLGVYTFVFHFVFEARWGRPVEDPMDFALNLFLGLILFWLFSECVTQAPHLIVNHASYVKKVVFPLEVLPWVVAAGVAFHTAIRLGVLVLAYAVLVRAPEPSLLLLPVVLLPLLVMTLGITWLLSALGVFFRDIGEAVAVGLTLVLFLCPIFYPVSAVPAAYRTFLYVNPLTVPVELARSALWGEPLSWTRWLLHALASWLVAWGGFAWFARARRSFADVL